MNHDPRFDAPPRRARFDWPLLIVLIMVVASFGIIAMLTPSPLP